MAERRGRRSTNSNRGRGNRTAQRKRAKNRKRTGVNSNTVVKKKDVKAYQLEDEASTVKPYKDKRGYIRHSNLEHRKIAYNEIYLKHRDEYALPFSKYVVHHIDGDKLNNKVSNLHICTKREHKKLHGFDSLLVNGKEIKVKDKPTEVFIFKEPEKTKPKNTGKVRKYRTPLRVEIKKLAIVLWLHGLPFIILMLIGNDQFLPFLDKLWDDEPVKYLAFIWAVIIYAVVWIYNGLGYFFELLRILTHKIIRYFDE